MEYFTGHGEITDETSDDSEGNQEVQRNCANFSLGELDTPQYEATPQ